jgi:hypothetical protein
VGAASDVVGVGGDPGRRAMGTDRQWCSELEEKERRIGGRCRQTRSSALGRLRKFGSGSVSAGVSLRMWAEAE